MKSDCAGMYSGNALVMYTLMYSVQILAGMLAILTVVVCGFNQCIQTYTLIMPRLNCDCFILDLFQLIIH